MTPLEMKPRRARVAMTRDDYHAYQWERFRRSRAVWRSVRLIFVVLLPFDAVLFYVRGYGLGQAITMFVGFSVVTWLLYTAFLYVRFALLIRRSITPRLRQSFGEPSTLELNERGLECTDDDEHLEFPWSEVREIWETEQRTFVRFGSGRALILARRDFDDDASFAEFVRTIYGKSRNLASH